LPPAEKRTGPDEFRRIKGSEKLPVRQQAALREVYLWREQRAAAADRPPFKIVGPEILLALAERIPPTLDDVARALASYPRQADQIEVVLAALERGLGLPEADLPARAPGARPAFPASARRRVDALRTWRTEQAASARLDPSVVLPQRLIDRLAAAGPRTLVELAAIEGMRQWRVAEWGPALLAASA
jgi:ribonuclease D